MTIPATALVKQVRELCEKLGEAAVQDGPLPAAGNATNSVGRHQFDAPILCATFVGIIRRDEVGLAEATRD
jgi:hypothetical protein